jgi:thiamine pyrophosphokinase
MHKQVFTLNFDFSFRSDEPDAAVKIFEVNTDNLSRYCLARTEGYCPRRKRFENLQKRAKQQGAKLWVLYNNNFSSNPEKARRWGIEDTTELLQENFFPATTQGLSQLMHELETSKTKNWVLILSVYLATNIQSHISVDTLPSDTQDKFIELLKYEKKNVVFIGLDQTLDKISNDKYLASLLLPKQNQPNSILIINGESPNQLTREIIDKLATSEIVIKPLSEHSGMGVHRTSNEEDLQELFVDMYSAHTNSELHKLTEKEINNSNDATYWTLTKGNNPLALCQEDVRGDMDHLKRITYRAVFTAYVIEDTNEVEIDIECIFPKKSDDGNFKSRAHNPISRSEIETAMQNESMKKSLQSSATHFITKLINYDQPAIIETLLNGSDAEFIKGLQLLSEKVDIDSELQILHLQRAHTIMQRLLVYAPQAFENIYGTIKKVCPLILPEILKHLLLSQSPFRLKMQDTLVYDCLLQYLLHLKNDERQILLEKNIFTDEDRQLLLHFLIGCKTIKEFITNYAHFSRDITDSEDLYSDITNIKAIANKLFQSQRYFFQLIVVINLFELRESVDSHYKDYALLFKIKYETDDILCNVFQQIDNMTDSSSIPYSLDNSLALALISFQNMSSDVVSHFPPTINGNLLSNYKNKFTKILNDHNYIFSAQSAEKDEPRTKQFLIVANGPFLPSEVILEAIGTPEKTIIALDGAARNLAEIVGRIPDVVLGDFDSITESTDNTYQFFGINETKNSLTTSTHSQTNPYPGKYGITIVPAPDQNSTDLQKAIMYCDTKNAASIHIVCAIGGRMDHHEGNVRSLRLMYREERPIYLHTEFQTLEYVSNNTVTIYGKKGDYCGILTAPACQYICKDGGLVWGEIAGESVKLKYGQFESTSNQMAKESAAVEIMGHALIVHPGQMKTQNMFFSLTEKERTKIVSEQRQRTLIEATVNDLLKFKDAYKTAKLNNNFSIFPSKSKNYDETFYVSSRKEGLKSMEGTETVLVSMSDNKCTKFKFFKQAQTDSARFDQDLFESKLRNAYENGEIIFHHSMERK